MLKLLLTLSFVLSFASAEVRSWLDTSEVFIGDRFTYHVQVFVPDSGYIELPDVMSNLAQFEVKNFDITDMKDSADGYVQTWKYSLSTFLSGEFEIPAQAVSYLAHGSDSTQFLSSTPLKLSVKKRVDGSITDIMDIEEPILAPAFVWWPWAVGGSALLLALGFLIWWLKKRPKFIRALTPFEKAQNSLSALAKSSLLDKLLYKDYTFELSEIVRQYLDESLGTDTLEKTTAELKRIIPALSLDESSKSFLLSFFQEADGVKYAKAPISSETLLVWKNGIEELLETNNQPEENS